jgi:hypothetical protein
LTEASIRSTAGDNAAAAAFHFLDSAADAEAELDLQDTEIVDPQKAQNAAEPLQKIGNALAQISRLRRRRAWRRRESIPASALPNSTGGIVLAPEAKSDNVRPPFAPP